MLVFSSINDGKEFISNPNNKDVIYESLIEDIKDALIFGLNFITIYRYEKENIHHFLYEEKWLDSLNKALEYHESNENYEYCIEIRDLINVLSDCFL